jgi:hypothetical protein
MKRISWSDMTRPGWDLLINDLRDLFGEPQQWQGSMKEPRQLEQAYQWAQGHHFIIGHPEVCVWVTDRIYTWYCLRWS